jgi:hypothetical protein
MSITTMLLEFIGLGINAAIEHNRGALPKSLYHYTNADVLYRIIKSDTLRASLITHLNDTGEYSYGLRVFADVLGGDRVVFPQGTEDFREALKVALERRERGLLEHPDPELESGNIFVFCLSAHADQLSQWRGYGDNARGYSLGFQASELENLQPRTRLIRVCYDKAAQYDMVVRGVTSTAQELAEWQGRPWREYGERLVSFCGYLIDGIVPALKAKGFKEEAEWRLVPLTIYGDPAYNNTDYFARGGILVPFVYLRNGEEKLPISKVYIGAALDQRRAELSLRGLLRSNGYHGVWPERSSLTYRP